MATKKYLELQEFTKEDLLAELKATEADYNRLLFDHAVKGLDNPLTLRGMRRDIARLNTEMRRRELAAMTEAQVNNRSKIRARRRKKY
jgi:large subunit ribosomal protein L29